MSRLLQLLALFLAVTAASAMTLANVVTVANIRPGPLGAAQSTYRPAETNLIHWSVAGVEGGIPNLTTVYDTLAAGSSLATVQAAWDAMPSNQVLELAGGVYNWSGSLNLRTRHHRVLRGSTNPASPTKIVNTDGQTFITDEYDFQTSSAIAISSGYTRGSTSIVLAATPTEWFTAGNWLKIRQNDDTNIVFNSGDGGPEAFENSIHFIESVSGNTLNFRPAIQDNLKASLNPVALSMAFGPGITYVGIEHITIDAPNSVKTLNYVGARNCWLKDVVLSNCNDNMVYWFNCSQMEVRRSTFRDSAGYPGDADSYGIVPTDTSFSIYEDNIFSRIGHPYIGRSGVMGNFFGYNFMTNSALLGITNRGGIDIMVNHGVGARFNAFEGNHGAIFSTDSYHGSDRNAIAIGNVFTGVNDWMRVHNITNWAIPMRIERGSYFTHLLRNILGSTNVTYVGGYQLTGEPTYETNAIYRVGYPSAGNNGLTETTDYDWSDSYPHLFPTMSSYPDPRTEATLVRHGNWDGFTKSVVFSNGLPTNIIPSVRYTNGTPPSWWPAGKSWPPFDANNPTNNNPTNLPAGSRWINGSN